MQISICWKWYCSLCSIASKAINHILGIIKSFSFTHLPSLSVLFFPVSVVFFVFTFNLRHLQHWPSRLGRRHTYFHAYSDNLICFSQKVQLWSHEWCPQLQKFDLGDIVYDPQLQTLFSLGILLLEVTQLNPVKGTFV